GCPGCYDEIVLIHAHHVRAFPAQHADHLQWHATHTHLFTNRRFIAEKLARRSLPHHADAGEPGHVAIGEGLPFYKSGPAPKLKINGGRAKDFPWLPVLVVVENLHAAIDAGRCQLNRRAFANDGVAVLWS